MGRPMLSYGIAKCTHRAVHTLSVNIAVFVRFPSLSLYVTFGILSLSLSLDRHLRAFNRS
jgi:hypothetical protein